jgi:hypothetical protein
METHKSQELYLLLYKHNRNNLESQNAISDYVNKYPYFFLLNWNLKLDSINQRKVALQSPFRSQYFYSIIDAPLSINTKKANKIESVESQVEIVNQFLTNQPSISRNKKNGPDKIDITDLSDTPYSLPVSETFANILVNQGKISLAIDIYTKLMLSKPEKRLYFASRISELTILLNQD